MQADRFGGGHTVNPQNTKFGVTSYDLLPTSFGAADLLGGTQDFFLRLRGDGTRPEEAALVLSRVNLSLDFVVPDFKLSSTVSALDEQRLYIDFIMGKRNTREAPATPPSATALCWDGGRAFSIASVLSGQGNPDKLKTLKEKQPDVYARLMKMAACVEMSTPAHGRYFAAPKEAAMKNVPDEVFTIAKQ